MPVPLVAAAGAAARVAGQRLAGRAAGVASSKIATGRTATIVKQQAYYSQLWQQRQQAQQLNIEDAEATESSGAKIGLAEAIFIVALVAFLGNDAMDWIWGAIDLGSGGVGVFLDWTINNSTNLITSSIIGLWFYFKGLRPNLMQKALISTILACLIDTIPIVGNILPTFTIQTIIMILVINNTASPNNALPSTRWLKMFHKS